MSYEMSGRYHEAIVMPSDEIKQRLGQVSSELAGIVPISGERRAADKEIDCLTFELTCRDREVQEMHEAL